MNFKQYDDYPDFKRALDFVFKVEGISSNDPSDRGGKTKFGISQRAYPYLNLDELTMEDAEKIYYFDYWWALACDQIKYPDSLLLFDSAVNHGVPRVLVWAKQIKEWKELLEIRKNFYKQIIERDPSQKKFERGWNNRLAMLEKEYVSTC